MENKIEKYLKEASKDLIRLQNAYARIISYIGKINKDKNASKEDLERADDLMKELDVTVTEISNYITYAEMKKKGKM